MRPETVTMFGSDFQTCSHLRSKRDLTEHRGAILVLALPRLPSARLRHTDSKPDSVKIT